LIKAAELIKSNGGKITTNPADAKITHIIQHEEDDKRYKELVRKYSK
jgi:hypothetical protein